MAATSVHPPFDPELAAALAAIPAGLRRPLLAEDIPAMRERLAQMMPADDDRLRRGGAVELEDRQIPGPPGAPDLWVLILRPAQGGGLWPGVYHIHGGGMIAGNRRTGAELLAG
jgi:acetyl esterase/lipase